VTDDAADTATLINSLASSAPLNFSFTTDRTIQVGSMNAGSTGSVTLTTNGDWTNFPGNNYTSIGIEQEAGSGITAGSVTLNANGYLGHAGTVATALNVDTANLGVSVNGNINVADSAALQTLDLTLAHRYNDQLGWIDNSYAITAPNIALTLIDQFNNGYNNVALQNLVSTSLQSFSLNATDANLTIGVYNSGTSDFTGGQIALGSGATANLSAVGGIWEQLGVGSYFLNDAAASPVADTAVAIKVGTLNLNAGGNITFSTYTYYPFGAYTSLPVEVNTLSVTAGGDAAVTNVGNLDVAAANVNGSAYLRAVEATPSTAASISGGSANAPIAAGDLTLVAYYGDIGAVGTPVITDTSSLSLDSGADIAAANLSQLAALSIISHHNKGSIGDTSNGGLNSLAVSDTSTTGGIPLQLGVTDLGVGGGGYQLTGLNAPQLDFAFQTDTSISVGALTANSVSLTSENAAILQIPSGGTITASAVSLSTPAGQSVGVSGNNILVNAPNLTVSTGGNMYVADSATLDSLSFNIGSVMDLGGSVVPVYHLDNSAASNPLAFGVAGDIVNNVLDVNSIVVSRTDAPVNIEIYAPYSGIGVNRITDDLVAGGTVNVTTQADNVFGRGDPVYGIRASNVNLVTNTGSIGDDFNGNAAPVVVVADNVSATTSADVRITSAQAIDNLSVLLDNGGIAAGATWAISTPTFMLSANAPSTGVLDLSAVSGTATNLVVDSYSSLSLGTLHLGSGTLTLNSYYGLIDSDTTNGAGANIITTADVSIDAAYGIGSSPATQIQTDIGGTLDLSNSSVGAINVDQVSGKPLTVGNLGTPNWSSNNPINITALSSLDLPNGLSAANSAGSAVVLTAGGDITYGGTLQLNGAPITIAAGGSIFGTNIYGATGVSLTAAGTAARSAGSVTVGNVDYYNYYGPASSPITVLAAGDISLTGQVVSSASVSMTSTNGSIYGQSGDTFSLTPTVTLTAHGDIGGGNSAGLTPFNLSGSYNDNPQTLNLSVQAGGQIDLQSYASVNATKLAGGGNVSLQVLGDGWHVGDIGLSFGQVSSTNGSVYLGTANGDITAIDGSSGISAATAITLTAQQNFNAYASNTPVSQAFNLGTSGTALALSAPQINLTANGNIYATVPTTGLTGLSVARTYVAYNSNNPGNQTIVMPASTVLIEDTLASTVFSVVDGGWAQGGVSVLTADYGTALNLGYSGNNAIELGTVALNGGNLSLQATNPFDISITSSGGLIQADAFSFNLVDANQIDGSSGTASGGFGTAANPIHTQIGSLSGTTVGATAGVFIDQDGSITFTNLSTGGDISVSTTRLGGALSANADISIGSVTSSGGSIAFVADGAIIAANGVNSPSITANGPSNDGDVTLTSAAGINLPSTGITSANGSINTTAAAGGIDMASSNLNALNGNVTAHAVSGGIDLTASAVQAGSTGSVITLTADQGNITLGSILTNGTVVVTAATGAIDATLSAQNLTGLANGIAAGSDITLNAATGIGSPSAPLSVNTSNILGDTITANTSGAGAGINLVTGNANPGGVAIVDANAGGSIDLGNYYSTLQLDNVQAQGDITVTQQNYYSQIVLNNVAATGPGATLSVVAPYGNIASLSTAGTVSASRIVLNALGDSSGGTLGSNFSPVNVDAAVVIAVASGDISLNSVATGATKMPLVASNGLAPTVSITSAGDFLVGQIVAGRQGTVDITSAADILDDGDVTTQIYAGTVNLTAADAIGTAATPIQLTAVAYDELGTATPGTISATSTALGSIYLDQQGDAILQSLVAADGSINVTVNDHAPGQSSLVFADSTATDQAGNDINVMITNGDLTVDQAKAGMTAGTVNLTAGAGSIYGDGRADCCTTPNVSGDSVNVTAQTNIGAIADLAALTGTALGIEANHSTAVTHAAASQIYLQYVGDATVGSSGPNSVSPLGSNAEVILAACGNLNLAGLNLAGASLGLNAGTGGNGGSVLDAIIGGAGKTNPDVAAARLIIGSTASVGSANAALWVNTPSLSATAAGGGVWINDAATTPVTVGSVTAGAGPVVIGTQGNLLVGSIDAGSNAATLNSAAGSVLDGISGGSSAAHPNVAAGSLTVNAATNAGGVSDALWVDAATVSANAATGGVWINDAAATPVTITSVTSGAGPVVIGSQGNLLIGSIDAGSGSATLNSAGGSVLDGISGGSSAAHPNVTAGSVSVHAAANAGGPSDALWVNAATISAAATTGGVWINDAATTPVTASSVTSGAGPVVIGSQGNLLIGSIDAGSGGATLKSADGAVLDGASGGSSAAHPNVVAGSVTIDAATSSGSAAGALWVDAALVNATSTSGGVWINDAATTPVTVSSVTAGAGPVVIGSQGNLLIGSIDAGSGSATLKSADGAVLDGISGGSSAAHPNVVAGSVTVDSATSSGGAGSALWVNAATISAAATTGGVWINDASTTPVTLLSVTAGGGPIAISSAGDLLLLSVDAGSGDVTLASNTGSVLDLIKGGASIANPNVRGGTVTLTAAKTVGLLNDPIWVDSTSYTAVAPSGHWVNVAAVFSPYPYLPQVAGVSPVTVYAADAYAQLQPPQQLPITLIGQPLRMAPPIAVTADLLGIALPAGVDSDATQQDSTMGTATTPILGGNEDEIGRKKATLKLKKKSGAQTTRNVVKKTRLES
jgi:hypothetical protein